MENEEKQKWTKKKKERNDIAPFADTIFFHFVTLAFWAIWL